MGSVSAYRRDHDGLGPMLRRSNNLTDAGPRNQTLSDQTTMFSCAQHARRGATMAISATTTAEYPGWIKIWFGLDAVLALFPPLYWAASGPQPAPLGLPLAVLYFSVTGLCIACSIVVAYLIESRDGNFTGGTP
ncbi:MAG: hypothetical protein B7X49_06920 [Acidiphilium sp. 34-64-41]|nr:MAG: hypothetical protein B7X49_06920 [Acidiphilium sp. 34-64-41]